MIEVPIQSHEMIPAIPKINPATAALVVSIFLLLLPGSASAQTSAELSKRLREAIDYWRGSSSVVKAEMTVHRSDWERSMRLESWTKGTDLSLVRFVAPPKDAGSASLTIGDEMWSYAPKVNRVLKIPASMMSQSWMGSDFSYHDLAKADDIVDDYDHKLLSRDRSEGQEVFVIESIPHDDAPVVWGKEVLKVRDDNIILEHSFYDQDMKLVKVLRSTTIAMLGGKLYPTVMRMESKEEEDRWTEIRNLEAQFGIEIADRTFTTSYLQNPR